MALGGRQRKAGEHLLAAARLDPLVAARLVELGDDYLKEGYVRQAAAIFQQAGDLARSMGDGELAYQIDQKIFSLARP